MSEQYNGLVISFSCHDERSELEGPIDDKGDFFTNPRAAFTWIPKGSKKKPFAIRLGSSDDALFVLATSEKNAMKRLMEAVKIGIYPVSQSEDRVTYRYVHDPSDPSRTSNEVIRDQMVRSRGLRCPQRTTTYGRAARTILIEQSADDVCRCKRRLNERQLESS